MTGWISLHRSLQEHKLWKVEPFTKGQAWVDLLLLTNHSEGFMTIKNGIVIDLVRGECGYSELGLSDRWQWSRGKVKRFLQLLKKEKMIQLKPVENRIIIVICNYDKFQTNSKQDSKRTVNEHLTVHQTDTNNNGNNGNNENTEPPDGGDSEKPKKPRIEYDPRFESFWKKYPKRNDKRLGKPSAFKEWQKAIKKEGITPEFIESAILFLAPGYGEHPKDAERWLKKELYLDYEEHQEQNEQDPFSAEKIIHGVLNAQETIRKRNEDRLKRLSENGNNGEEQYDIPF